MSGTGHARDSNRNEMEQPSRSPWPTGLLQWPPTPWQTLPMIPDPQPSLLEDEETLAARRAWARALPLLAKKLTRMTYESFVQPIKPIALCDRSMELGVANGFALEWVERRCSSAIKTALETVLGYGIEVAYRILSASERADTDPRESAKPAAAAQPAPARPRQPDPHLDALHEAMSIPLDDKLSFDNFVVGQSNRLAYTVALEVADEPGVRFNPLFIYGPSGLGKTHLLHSIGQRILQLNASLRVVLTDGETFTHFYVNSLREKKFDVFRRYFRSVDVWLVDDIQTIAGREHTKEEFFHTFNALHQTRRQIVLTSDKTPRELRAMDDRLRTRFEAGLIADVAPPSIETRLEILSRRCRAEGWEVPDDVLFFIADAIQSNVRALEGAVTRLVVHASVLRVPMDVELAHSVLTHFFIDKRPLSKKPRVPIEAVVDVVAEAFAIPADAIVGHRRDRNTALARQVAMYLARELCDESCRAIGVAVGGRDHTTVQRAAQKIEGLLPTDGQLRSLLLDLRGRLCR